MREPDTVSEAVSDVVHPVRLTTSDRVTLTIDVPDGTSVVDAAAATGYVLPGQCHAGTCGSCHAAATGAYRLGPHSAAALPDAAAAAGQVLLCRTYPTGPVEVTAPYARSRILDGRPGRREGVVTDVVRVAAQMVWVQIALESDDETGAGYQFDPGQFVEVQVPGDERRRAYSLVNTGNWNGTAELLVKLHPGGYFSGYLTDLLDRWPVAADDGARLVLHGPTGAFGLRESGRRPRWFVAGGTGLAPVLSLLRRMAEWGEPHPVRLFLGVPTPADLPRLPVLAELATTLPTLRLAVCVEHPDDGWTGAVGNPLAALEAAVAEHTGTAPDVYVCGPPGLVDAVAAVAAPAGLPPVVAERVLPT
ncbi:MAG: 2Fe-2S iron-sulfur cluster binding domain-containing protein [Micrococcales bacterium]|nr:2Fe-2S iron-sulfur cluster binding domain-containing protein [Micrococcales bacterium]